MGPSLTAMFISFSLLHGMVSLKRLTWGNYPFNHYPQGKDIIQVASLGTCGLMQASPQLFPCSFMAYFPIWRDHVQWQGQYCWDPLTLILSSVWLFPAICPFWGALLPAISLMMCQLRPCLLFTWAVSATSNFLWVLPQWWCYITNVGRYHHPCSSSLSTNHKPSPVLISTYHNVSPILSSLLILIASALKKEMWTRYFPWSKPFITTLCTCVHNTREENMHRHFILNHISAECTKPKPNRVPIVILMYFFRNY